MASLLDDLAHLSGTVGAADSPSLLRPHGDRCDASAGRAVPIGGQALRYALSLALLDAGELTVPQLVQRVEAAGYVIDGRASKSVSDALRWEVDHARVVRVGRGRYRTGRIPRSTVRWMQRRLDERRAAAIAWFDAGDDTTPTPPTRTTRTARPSGLTLYRRQQRRQRERAARLADQGIQPMVQARQMHPEPSTSPR